MRSYEWFVSSGLDPVGLPLQVSSGLSHRFWCFPCRFVVRTRAQKSVRVLHPAEL